MFNLDPAVGYARVGCDGVRWQGGTTLRANARQQEQRGQRAPAPFNRVGSAFTPTVTDMRRKNVSVHAVLPKNPSDQLPDLG